MAALKDLRSLTVGGPEVAGDPVDEPLRTRIKDAVNLGNEGDAPAALHSLQRIRSEVWASASQRSRHRILNAIGFVHLSLDEIPLAVDTLRQAHSVDPGKPWSLSALAFAEYLEGNHVLAFAHAKEALEADPTLEQAAIGLIHNADEAAVSLTQLSALLPEKLMNKSQVLLAMSAAADKRDDAAAALHFSEQAYAAEPDTWRTQATLAHELIKPVLAAEGIALTRMIPEEQRKAFDR